MCGCETQPGCLRGAAVLAGQLLWRREEELPSVPALVDGLEWPLPDALQTSLKVERS